MPPPGSSSFTCELDKALPSDLCLMAWCPTMDLIAMVLADGTLDVRRLSWQRLFDPMRLPGAVVDLCWAPDAAAIALAYADNRIDIVSVERARLLHSIPGEALGAARIRTLHWTTRARDDDDDDAVGSEGSRAPSVLPALPSVPRQLSANRFLVAPVAERSPDARALSVLAVGHADGRVRLYAQGAFCIGVVDLQAALQTSWFVPRCPSPAFDVVGLHASPDLRRVCAVVRARTPRTDVALHVAVDVGIVRRRHRQIRLLAVQAEQVAFLLAYLAECTGVWRRLWTDARRALDLKVATLADLLSDHDEGGSVGDALLALLVSGHPGQSAMLQYLTHVTGPAVARLHKTWQATVAKLADVARRNLVRGAEELVLRLTELRGLARVLADDNGDDDIGLDVDLLADLVARAGRVIDAARDLQDVLSAAYDNFRHFLQWLTTTANRVSDEGTDLDIVSPVDVHRAAAFISDDLDTDRVLAALDKVDVDAVKDTWQSFRGLPAAAISRRLSVSQATPLFRLTEHDPLASFAMSSSTAGQHLLAFLHHSRVVVLKGDHDRGLAAHAVVPHAATRVSFYNSGCLALLCDAEGRVGCRLVLAALDSVHFHPHHDHAASKRHVVDVVKDVHGYPLECVRSRTFPHASGHHFAVCGTRGVVAVLSGSRRVLVIDTENDEEFDDDEDMQDA
ncbi:Anaphase-promoting complex subunit 4 [Plasmodiophora brassicae]